MVLHLVTKRKANPSLSIRRVLLPVEEDALRRVKLGIDLPGADPVYRATVGYARKERLWILCDCRDGKPGERPVIVPVRIKETGQLHLTNIGRAEVPHVQGCPFAPGEDARRRKPAIVFGDVLHPVAARRVRADGEEPGKGPQRRLTGPGTDSQSSTLAGHLHRLMRAASLHRLSAAEGFASPGEWLAAIRRAAGTFRSPEDIVMSELLFTDPKSWASGHVARVLDRLEPPGQEGKLSGWLCWLARDIDGSEVNRAHPALGHVRVLGDVAFPTVMGSRRVEGPWLFMGEVGRSPNTGRWQCLEACARPIASACCPVPVDSHNERRALGALRSMIRSLETDAELGEALGGAVRLDLEKPLFDIQTVGGPCRPDFILTAVRPGGEPAGGRHLPGDAARYVIEVMGLDAPEYESRKAKTHRSMRNLGRILPLNARRFDSRGDGIQRQADRTARRIRNDLILRWGRTQASDLTGQTGR
ncbi:MAG: hypothetical protein F4X35_11995 [Alphaproteobacteria bacterium]|nr:hypothetical protein [Alphaproteobacteria bacterium]